MRPVAWTLFTVLLLSFEGPLLRHVDRWWLAPDLLVLAALYLGSRCSWLVGLSCAAAIGLWKDAFSLAAPVGTFVEIGTLLCAATSLLGNRLDLRSTLPTMAAAGGATFAAVGLFLLFQALFHRNFGAFDEVLRAAPPMALGTMLAAPVVFWIYDRIGDVLSRGDRIGALPDRRRDGLRRTR